MKLLAKSIVLVGVVTLSACTPTAKFSDGSTLEVRAASNGATEYAVAQYNDAKTGKRVVDMSRTDSMTARVVPGVAATATGALINGAAGLAIANKQKCGNANGCGNTIVQAVAQQTQTAGTETNVEVTTGGSTPCLYCTEDGGY